ncbi:MAG: sugar kinase [Acidobacteria bacterium]|nr:sugar kinase [Acidobacteriota bacterium]
MTSRLVCLDTVMVDVALDIGDLPPRGGDALSSQRTIAAGGGFNVMSAARRQGHDVAYLGQLGLGPMADLARATLEGEGVEILVNPRGPLDLGLCIVLVDQGAERTFVTSPGAELTLSGDELRRVRWREGDVLYVSGYDVVYPDLAQVVVPWLSELDAGVVVGFDPGPRALDIDDSVRDAVLSRTNWLLLNDAEARLLSNADSPEKAIRYFTDRYDFDGVVVRLGARGCVVRAREELWDVGGFSVTARDTNGAGDVHNGVMLAALVAGESVEVAARRANAAAALSVTVFGPATGPSQRATDEFLEDRAHEARPVVLEPNP